jgi:hypothetical protein
MQTSPAARIRRPRCEEILHEEFAKRADADR